MARKSTKTPASDKVSIHRAPKTHRRDASSSSSSSLPQDVAQTFSHPSRPTNSTGSTLVSDWTSAFGLDESDTHRASLSTFTLPKPNTKAGQQILHKRNTPTSIMTTFNGVPVYSTGISAHPFTAKVPNARELQEILSKNGTLAAGKILLPKLDHTLRSNPSTSTYRSSSRTTPTAPPADPIPPPPPPPPTAANPNRSPSPNPPQTSPPPFDPSKCHWRALRDVAFVRDGGMEISSEDLCALLRFRYGESDPQMARVEPWHVEAMYDFCKVGPKEMYEETAGGLIKGQMGKDLQAMREGEGIGVGVVSRDF